MIPFVARRGMMIDWRKAQMENKELRPCPINGEQVTIATIPNDYTEIKFSNAEFSLSFQSYGRKKAIELWNSAWCWKEIDRLEEENERLHIEASKGWYTPTKERELQFLKAQNQKMKEALEKISNVTQFDHPQNQIIGSEEYEGAWLDCLGIAKEALKETQPIDSKPTQPYVHENGIETGGAEL